MSTSQPLPPEFDAALVRAADRVSAIASRALWFPEITSTNDVAVRLGEADADEGLLVVADGQTAGRGRRGRQWASPPGAGIYATVLLRPPASTTPLLTIAAGVAVAEGIQAASGLPTLLKWPNDVFIETRGAALPGRKVAGILAERGTSLSGPWVALGFGINVLPGAYPLEVAVRATSLEAELGRQVDRPALLVECLAALATRYADLQARRSQAVLEAWRRRAAATLGRSIEWDGDGGLREGVVKDIDETGALLVHGEGGLLRVISGEVRWR